MEGQPIPASDVVREKMRRQRRTETGPELLLRKELRSLGLVGYRLHQRPVDEIGRTADIVFRKGKLAVFVQGCWWHGCYEHWRPPKNNQRWWTTKIERTRLRDRETDGLLAAHGWKVVRVWEHEDPQTGAGRVLQALGD